ncbi:LysR family transcriptional regulator [Luteimonas gilva]|uniref:LysR family transcriptional regulator n=1 Tax=Luteimonas gilva TaxID=2572684 RepID=A0A4U5JN91_9GAMM|nr:LysR family transcriptional regulator [Luteimonas gilva]TKR31074.1 LysR family transcriptional regulator [Luteimonas gilva]
MSRPDLALLTIFAEVAQRRSFRAAARHLRLSPSAVSQAVGKLEARLEVRLLARTTRSVAPTEDGRRLLQQIGPALDEIGDAMTRFREARGEPAGSLRIVSHRLPAQLLIAPRMAAFSRAHPQVALEIFVDDALVDIVSAGFDAGVRLHENLEGDMVATSLGGAQRMIAVAAPHFFDAHRKLSHPRELAKLPCLGLRLQSGRIYDWEFERNGERVAVAVSGPITFNDDDIMLMAARDGAGIAFAFEKLIEEDLRTGRLVPILEDWSPSFPGFSLYYPSRRQLRPALRAFIDWMA